MEVFCKAHDAVKMHQFTVLRVIDNYISGFLYQLDFFLTVNCNDYTHSFYSCLECLAATIVDTYRLCIKLSILKHTTLR